jgi:hypothetical protein
VSDGTGPHSLTGPERAVDSAYIHVTVPDGTVARSSSAGLSHAGVTPASVAPPVDDGELAHPVDEVAEAMAEPPASPAPSTALARSYVTGFRLTGAIERRRAAFNRPALPPQAEPPRALPPQTEPPRAEAARAEPARALPPRAEPAPPELAPPPPVEHGHDAALATTDPWPYAPGPFAPRPPAPLPSAESADPAGPYWAPGQYPLDPRVSAAQWEEQTFSGIGRGDLRELAGRLEQLDQLLGRLEEAKRQAADASEHLALTRRWQEETVRTIQEERARMRQRQHALNELADRARAAVEAMQATYRTLPREVIELAIELHVLDRAGFISRRGGRPRPEDPAPPSAPK